LEFHFTAQITCCTPPEPFSGSFFQNLAKVGKAQSPLETPMPLKTACCSKVSRVQAASPWNTPVPRVLVHCGGGVTESKASALMLTTCRLSLGIVTREYHHANQIRQLIVMKTGNHPI